MVPPVPPHHFPPGQPAHPGNFDGPPRIFQRQTPSPIDPIRLTDLTDQMGRLDIATEGLHSGNSNSVSPRYKGYTFFKADPVPGQRATWNRAKRTKMDLSETELIKMVQKKSNKTLASQQYQKLSKSRRSHVDQLIEEHRLRDPHTEWNCVYVKEVEKPVKGKDARRGDYETASMDIVIKGTPASPLHTQTSVVDLDSRVGGGDTERGIRSLNKGVEDNAPFQRLNGPPGAFHPPMHGPHGPRHHLPPQFQQQHPPMAHGPPMGVPPMNHGPMSGQGPVPGQRLPLPGQGPPMGGPSQMLQGPMQVPWPPIPQANHPPPGIHGHPHRGPGPGMDNGPGFEILNGPRSSPSPGPRPNQMRPPFAPSPDQFQKLNKPHPKANHHITKPVNMYHNNDPDWAHDGSSVEDDQFTMFDQQGYSSGTEDTDHEIHEGFIPGRGSLYRHNSKKQPRARPIYRSHHRPQGTKYLDKKHSPKCYPSYYIVVPAVSKGASKRERKALREMTSPSSRNRPKITQARADTSADEECIQDKLRGGRDRDLRSLLLDDREARLEHREKMIEHQSRMLDGRFDGRLDGQFDEIRYNRHHLPRRREPLYSHGSPYLH